jgi:hypothetical protein
MNIKQLCVAVVLSALAVMGAPTVAVGQATKAQPEQNQKPRLLVPAVRFVNLRCSVERLGKTEIALHLFNQTKNTIRRGTMVYWQITQKARGSFDLEEDFVSLKSYRTSVKPTPPGTEFFFNPQAEPPIPVRAWYNPRQIVRL